MESTYDTKMWARETTIGRRIFNLNFRMMGRELPGWQLVKTVPMHQDRMMVETVYMWQSQDAPDRHVVHATVTTLHDWRLAQKQLIHMLNHTMRPDLPCRTGASAAAGDIEFVARAPVTDIPASIQFSRGNVAVAVSSVGSANVDVLPVAAVMDRMLIEAPGSVSFLRALAKQIAPRTVTFGEGEASAKLVSLSKVRDAWLKAIVEEGEIRQKDDALMYFSKRLGRRDVQVFSISRGEPAARKTVKGSRS
ncbi:hypothetical protein QTH90_30095 [Variovorax sp. J2P1-59]|uniref:hypothetical protein n=1 Tax=Variovorax flavidus TaxID=3053501 RepID=UPI002575A088|nr:hypothetical protein [Variovorax sp. J2P1-59]MDM0078693.1 hypothetical protein [Variovorax sp. J2P1-59]